MHPYRTGLDGTGLRRLDKDNFNHTGDLADNCRYFVDTTHASTQHRYRHSTTPTASCS